MKRIVIVGLGLIGGSLAQACRKALPRARIIGVTRSRRALATAKRKKWIHEGYRGIKHAFQNVGVGLPRLPKGAQTAPPPLVILCTPVDTLKNLLLKLDRAVPPGTIVTDAGSVKGFLVCWADRRRWRRIRFVGAHPLAGSHERGIEHARRDLFKGALTFVTPGRRSGTRCRQAVGIVKNFWKKICRQVVVLSPEEHDQITADVSHLPHLAASALVEGAKPKNLPYAAGGFLDTTRVAASDPDLWVPIFIENQKELSKALGRFEWRLKNLKKALKRCDRGKLRKFLTASARRRRGLS